MFTKRSILRMFSVLLVILLMSSTASARPLEEPLGTGFTYQGKLTDGGTPANGLYDFEFKLYDALSSGSPVGGTVTLGDVTVTNGLFTVQLDFGNVFDGTALYLDIGVRLGTSVGAYTALIPRQQLSATPYALYASRVPWSGLTGVPAGFADGIDNGSAYENVRVVAKSGGDFTTITAALNSITTASDTNRFLIYVAPGVYNEQVTMKQYVDIEGAGELNTWITQIGNSSGNTGTVVGYNNAELRFLTVVNTGGAAYATAIFNPTNVAPRLTHITARASGGTSENSGVYNYSSSPTMTNVSASASGGLASYGVYNVSSSPIMKDESASASGGTYNYGVFNISSSSPTMTNITASALGGTYSYGVYNDSSSPIMTDITASALEAANNYGVYNLFSSPTMTNVIVSASGGTNNLGVYNGNSSSPTMTNIRASATWGTNSNSGVYNNSSSPTMTNVSASTYGGTSGYGVYNYRSSLTMTNVTASASGGENNHGVFNYESLLTINNSVISGQSGTNNYGIYNAAGSDAASVLVNNSQISGLTNTIRNDAHCATLVGASQLSGGAVSAGGGTVTCAGVYDENYAFYTTTCP